LPLNTSIVIDCQPCQTPERHAPHRRKGFKANFFRRNPMLKYAIIFALISLVAGALGFGGVAAGSAGIAKILFGLFLILAVIFIVLAALGVGAVNKVMK
jgi:uncharacterized membrane protein YtjA (UPF0391 family)